MIKLQELSLPASSPAVARVAHRVACTEAEGPGKRYALWLQGCPLRCAGCCNPHFLSFTGGAEISVFRLREEIRSARDTHHLEGITLLGGEPTSQPGVAANLLEFARELGLNTLVFSGHTHEQLQLRHDPETKRLLAATDWLVDGPYDQTKPEQVRRFIGSANQRLLTLSDRVRPDDPRWIGANTLEIRLENGQITVNGFPTPTLANLSPWLGKMERRNENAF